MVPAYHRRPRWLADHIYRPRATGTDITRGWVEAFEPDYLVELAPGLAAATGYEEQFVVTLAQVLELEPVTAGYGISVADAYESAYEQVYRFTQRHPDHAILCDPARRADALWSAALFGALPDAPPTAALRTIYRQTFDPELIRLDGESFTRFLFTGPQPITPLAAGTWALDLEREIEWRSMYFVFDPRSVLDITHLWSLRAYGLRFYPVPSTHLDRFAWALRRRSPTGSWRACACGIRWL